MNHVLISHALSALRVCPTIPDAIESTYTVIRECYYMGDRGIPWECCSKVSVERAIYYVLRHTGPDGPTA